jgi:hypothetical protein
MGVILDRIAWSENIQPHRSAAIVHANRAARVFACVKDPVKGAEAKSAASIDKACPTFPSCAVFMTGADWTNAVEGVIDGQTPMVFCGSPSGAFLN